MDARFTRPVKSWRSLRAGDAFEGVHEGGHGDLRRVLDEQVHVVVLAGGLGQLGVEVGAHLARHFLAAGERRGVEDARPILGHEDHVHVDGRNHVPASPLRRSSGSVVGRR
jgi:hypothetical protein